MSSSSTIGLINFSSAQINNYFGISTVILGVIGGLLNMIVFLSLRIFRESSCGIYLIVMSIVHIIQLVFGYLYRIVVTGSFIPWLGVSILSCTVRFYLNQICGGIATSCICLSLIDQYLATSKHPRLNQWSNRKASYWLCALMCAFWMLLVSPHLVYYRPEYLSSTNTTICMIINPVYQYYVSNVYTPVLAFVLVYSTMILFGILAYRNVQSISHRTVPLVRRQHEIQITKMILILAFLTVLFALPFFLMYVLTSNIQFSNDAVVLNAIQLALLITLWLLNVAFAIPFYVFVSVSKRYRQQLVYVLCKIHCERCRERQVAPNEIALESVH